MVQHVKLEAEQGSRFYNSQIVKLLRYKKSGESGVVGNWKKSPQSLGELGQHLMGQRPFKREELKPKEIISRGGAGDWSLEREGG